MSKFSPEYAIAKLKSRMDAEEVLSDREDALQCKPGNKPCGKRCIPQDQKCKAEGGGAYNSTAGKIARTAVGVGVGAAALLAYNRSKQGGANGLAGNPPNRPALPPSRKDSSLGDRLDSFIREDKLQCKPGNKPCGKRCIPEKQNCAVETAKGAVKTAGKVLYGAATVAGVGTLLAKPYFEEKLKEEIARRGQNLTKEEVANERTKAREKRNRGKMLPPSGGTGRQDSSIRDRLDSFIREDKLQCKPGNKPCGKRCIPEKQNCAVETAKGAAIRGLQGGILAGPLGAVGGAVYGGMRARGNSRRKSAAFGTAAALGTAAAFVGAGVAGEARRQGAKEKDEMDEAYQTLGVKKGASADEVRAAYKAAAKKYHPDINKDPKATEKLAKINAAMDRLDPRKQAAAKDVKAERRRGRGDSLSSRVDAFMLFKIQDAYKSIQQDFPEVTQDFWYSR